MKIVYSDPKTGRTAQAEVGKEQISQLLNLKIGDTLDGSVIALSGYKLKITGGSDSSGFPMNRNVLGARKLKVMRGRKSGQMSRLTVVGNLVSTTTAQINAIIIEYGDKSAEEIFPPIKPKEEKTKEEKAKEEKAKPEKPKEEQPKVEKPKEEKIKTEEQKEEKVQQ